MLKYYSISFFVEIKRHVEGGDFETNFKKNGGERD